MFERANDAEIAWVAGMYEGEGCISKTRGRGTDRFLARVQITSTDSDVLDRIGEITNAGRIYWQDMTKYGENRKPLGCWVLNRQGQIDEFFMAVCSWLGRRRREQMEDILADCAYYQELQHV